MPLWDNVNCNRSLGFLDMYKGGCDGCFSLDVGFFPVDGAQLFVCSSTYFFNGGFKEYITNLVTVNDFWLKFFFQDVCI